MCADIYSPEKRRDIMARVKTRNTPSERRVRSLLHRMGYRFRLHRRDLPGTPDIVLPKFKTAIFVHGCFWHRHPQCPRATTPKSNIEFWEEKFRRNMERDRTVVESLEDLGWKVLIIWECELKKDLTELRAKLESHLPRREFSVTSS